MSHTQVEVPPPSTISWRERLQRYYLLVRLHRPIGSLLLLWPALWALWLAGAGQPPWGVVVIFLVGGVLMRSAGCAINDFADRDFDGHVTRTKERPLATGAVTPKEAMGVFLSLSFVAFLLELQLNWQTIALSVVALLLTFVYPFMKRFTHVPQLFLGAAFGWAVPMAFTAVTETIPLYGWVVFISALVWSLVYDTQYAMVDREDDLKIGVKSTAILFGAWDRLVIGLLQILFLGLLFWVGEVAGRGWIYQAGLLVAAGFFVYQQRLTWHRDRSLCFQAFLNNNYVGMAIFVGLVLDYALLG